MSKKSEEDIKVEDLNIDIMKKDDESTSNRVAMSLITDENDNILMGKRNDSGKWTTPGGHLEVNEDPFEGMARELKEEAGLDAKEIKIIRVEKKGKMLIYVMKVTVDPDQEIDASNDPDEECDDWSYEDPNDCVENLHVELEKNVVLKAWLESES
jgi:8-oxo-dGTP pyrophosphatase MutT (NUDIX family)